MRRAKIVLEPDPPIVEMRQLECPDCGRKVWVSEGEAGEWECNSATTNRASERGSESPPRLLGELPEEAKDRGSDNTEGVSKEPTVESASILDISRGDNK